MSSPGITGLSTGKKNWRTTVSFFRGQNGFYFLLFIAVAAKIFQLIYLFDTRYDMSHQVLAAYNLQSGAGISMIFVDPENLYLVKQRYLNEWPPGYSILILPLLWIFGDYIPAAITVNILAAITMLLSGAGILRLLKTPALFINLFLMATGFTLFYSQLEPTTDFAGTALFLLCTFLSIKLMVTSSHTLSSIIFLTGALLLLGFMKYQYTPLVFLFPASIFFYARIEKNKKLQRASGFIFLFLTLAFIAFFTWQRSVTGSAAYIQQQERGFSFQNLALFHPFITSGLIKEQTLESAGLGGRTIYLSYRIIHILVLLGIVISGTRLILASSRPALARAFALLFLGAMAATIALLFTLSLTVAPEGDINRGSWTYVLEPRYYDHLLLLLIVALFALAGNFSKRSPRNSITTVLLLLLIFPETARGMIFTVNRVRYAGSESYSWQKEQEFQEATATILKRNFKEHETIRITSTSEWMLLRAVLKTKLPAMWKGAPLNDHQNLQASEPVSLFVIASEGNRHKYQPFLDWAAPYYIGSFRQYTYYKIPVAGRP